MLLLGGLCISLLAIGCASRPIALVVGQAANNSTVTLGRGQQLHVTLPSNATTGYKWVLESDPDPEILFTVGDSYRAPQDAAPGQGGMETWTFSGVAAGQTSVVLRYIKPSAPNDAPGEEFRLSVTVQ
jgi:inhibitor of cysteine peptidase